MSENLEAAAVDQETAVVEAEAAVEPETAEAVVEAVEAVEAAADEATPPSSEASTETIEATVEAVEAVADEVSADDMVADDVVADGAVVSEEVVEASAEDTPVEETSAEETAGEEAPVADDAPAEDKAEESTERVVRVLSVGMEVAGKVKRTTDFGAFVDIGVGRDGLVHISELSVRRVAKVSDVVKEGQEVTAWIKELDRSRNRISLTLIPPGTKTIRDLEKDEIVTGTVTRMVPYGAFVDIGVGRDALLHIREMADGYINKPEDVVKEGETVEARIIEISRRRGRIDLSMKGLNPEAEAEGEGAVEIDEDEEIEDPFENLEVLSPMELAFQKAMSENAEEVEGVTRKRNKRTRRQQMRSMQDEIVSRTLKTGRPG